MAAAESSTINDRFERLEAFIPDKIWLKLYLVKFHGMKISARTTIVRLESGKLWIHSPGPLDEDFRQKMAQLGDVAYLIAPGDFHHLHVADWQKAYPEAKVYIAPRVEQKQKTLKYDEILSDDAVPEWQGDFEQQAYIDGKKMCEVVFLHKPSNTLIATDIVEYITDDNLRKDGVSDMVAVKFWTTVFRMKNRPLPAPEYRMSGYAKKVEVARKLKEIAEEWCPENLIISHGDCVMGKDDVRKTLLECWADILVLAK